MIDINKITADFSGDIKEVIGDKNFSGLKISSFTNANKDSIVFCYNEKNLDPAFLSEANVLIIQSKTRDAAIQKNLNFGKTLILSDKPDVLVAKLLNKFQLKSNYITHSKNNVISEKAKIHPTAVIAPHCFIDDDVVIGEKSVIEANTYIGKSVVIGDNVRIGSFNYIGENTVIKNNVVILSSNTIGSDAFIPEDRLGFVICNGNVVLEENVELGVSNVVERGLVNSTLICSGTKIDNKVFVGSESVIGPYSFITASVNIGHHVNLGHHFVIGGSSNIKSNVNICDMVQIAGNSYVHKDIKKAGAYGGFPLQDIKSYLKTSMSLKHITQLRRDVSSILKKLTNEI